MPVRGSSDLRSDPVSEILQNIDAVLGIAMSVFALLGLGRFWGRGQVATMSETVAPPAAPPRKSRFGRYLLVFSLLGAMGLGGYITANWMGGGRGYFNGERASWRDGGRDSRRWRSDRRRYERRRW